MRIKMLLRKTSDAIAKKRSLLFAFTIYVLLITDFARVVFDYYVTNLQFLVVWIRNLQYIFIACCFAFIFSKDKGEKPTVVTFFVSILYIVILSLTVLIQGDLLLPFAKEVVVVLFLRLIPMLYIGISVKDWKELVKSVNFFSLIAMMYALFCLLHAKQRLVENPLGSIHNKYMLISNNLNTPLLISLLSFFVTKKWRHLLYASIPLAFIILYGSRGALVRILLAVVIYGVLVYYPKNRRRFAIYFLLFGLSLFVLFAFSSQLAAVALRIFPHSRTILMIRDGNFLAYANRMNHIEAIIAQLLTAPFAIRGFFADSVINSAHFGVPLSSGMYAHNLFVEILADFGIILGGLFIAATIAMLVLAFSYALHSKDQHIKIAFSVFVSSIFVQSMVSNSIMDYPYFWLMYGVMIQFTYYYLVENLSFKIPRIHNQKP